MGQTWVWRNFSTRGFREQIQREILSLLRDNMDSIRFETLFYGRNLNHWTQGGIEIVSPQTGRKRLYGHGR